MNPYRDWMMDFYRNKIMNKIMNHKNSGAVGDLHLLAARKKRLALALEQGGKQSRNEKRLATVLQGGTGHTFFSTHARNPR